MCSRAEGGACAPNAIYDAAASCGTKTVADCATVTVNLQGVDHEVCAVRNDGQSSSCEVSEMFVKLFAMSTLCATGTEVDCAAITMEDMGGMTICGWDGSSCVVSGLMQQIMSCESKTVADCTATVSVGGTDHEVCAVRNEEGQRCEVSELGIGFLVLLNQ